MNNFSQAVKYLDFNRARAATIDEARNNARPFDKYYELKKSRVIKKISTFLKLPILTLPYIPRYNSLHRLLGQFNVTAPKNFHILNANTVEISENLVSAVLTVKFRIGTDVYRYVISISSESITDPFDYLYGIPFYNNEQIMANCVFELWRASVLSDKYPLATEMGIQAPIYIKTSLIQNPVTPDDISVIYDESGTFKTLDEIGFTMPANMPIDNTVNVWNDN